MPLVESYGFSSKQMERNSVAGKCVNDKHVESHRRFVGQRSPRVTSDAIDLGWGIAHVREKMLCDGVDGWVDLIKADLIVAMAVSGDGSDAEANDADVARAALAAEAQRQAHAGIFSVVGGGRSAQLRRKDLRAVLDGAVGKRAHDEAGIGRSGLADAEATVEITNGKWSVALIRGVNHEDQNDQQDAGDGPKQTLRPSARPGDRQRQQRGSEK